MAGARQGQRQPALRLPLGPAAVAERDGHDLAAVFGPTSDRIRADGSIVERNTGRKENEYSSLDLRLVARVPPEQPGPARADREVFNLFGSKNYKQPSYQNLVFNFDGTIASGLGDARQMQLGARAHLVIPMGPARSGRPHLLSRRGFVFRHLLLVHDSRGILGPQGAASGGDPPQARGCVALAASVSPGGGLCPDRRLDDSGHQVVRVGFRDLAGHERAGLGGAVVDDHLAVDLGGLGR